jgi:AraC-like DNA-binding protein
VRATGFGQFIFWGGGSLYIGSAVAPSELHSHHAIQLSIGLHGKVQFKTRRDGDWIHYDGALIPPDLLHTFQAPGNVLTHIFCEPESLLGRRILGRFGATGISTIDPGEARACGAPLRAAYFDRSPDEQLIALAREALARLVGEDVPVASVDPRITRAFAEIERRLEEPLTLAGIAAHVGLSEGRFRHLFVSETGISFRGYVLWSRLNRALGLGYSGASWTEAAHAANFADSAHLTRTCRRMFGITPTSIGDDGGASAEVLTA